MQIMIDSNVLISSILFPESIVNRIIKYIEKRYVLVISEYVLNETRKVVRRKFPDVINRYNNYLDNLDYTLYKIVVKNNIDEIYVRDAGDTPILMSFIKSGADILITGDNDFFTPELAEYNILKPGEFYKLYMTED